MNELATKSPDTAVMKTAKDLLGRFLSSNLPRINTDTVKRDSSKITYNLTEDKLSMVGKIDSSKLKLGLRDSLKVTPGASTTVGTSSTIPKIEYKLDLKSTHAFIAILNNDINSNNLINAITSYNAKNFSTMRLDVNNLKIGDKNTILIQSFSDGNKAGFYLKFIEAEKGIFDSYKKEDYTLYHISSDNLTTVLKNGHLNDYDQFYKEHYK